MTGEKMPLLLGVGLREGPLASDDYRLVFDGPDFALTDLGLSRRADLGIGSPLGCQLAYDHKREQIYFAGVDAVMPPDSVVPPDLVAKRERGELSGGIDAIGLRDRARRRIACGFRKL